MCGPARRRAGRPAAVHRNGYHIPYLTVAGRTVSVVVGCLRGVSRERKLRSQSGRAIVPQQDGISPQGVSPAPPCPGRHGPRRRQPSSNGFAASPRGRSNPAPARRRISRPRRAGAQTRDACAAAQVRRSAKPTRRTTSGSSAAPSPHARRRWIPVTMRSSQRTPGGWFLRPRTTVALGISGGLALALAACKERRPMGSTANLRPTANLRLERGPTLLAFAAEQAFATAVDDHVQVVAQDPGRSLAERFRIRGIAYRDERRSPYNSTQLLIAQLRGRKSRNCLLRENQFSYRTTLLHEQLLSTMSIDAPHPRDNRVLGEFLDQVDSSERETSCCSVFRAAGAESCDRGR